MSNHLPFAAILRSWQQKSRAQNSRVIKKLERLKIFEEKRDTAQWQVVKTNWFLICLLIIEAMAMGYIIAQYQFWILGIR